MPSKTLVISPPADLIKKFRGDVDAVVRRTAGVMMGRMRILAPIDTGFLRNSITVQKLAQATYAVAVGAEYGFWVNYGTRRLRAQPFFEPAVEEARRYFEAELKKLI